VHEKPRLDWALLGQPVFAVVLHSKTTLMLWLAAQELGRQNGRFTPKPFGNVWHEIDM
jgi:hypothetical protein